MRLPWLRRRAQGGGIVPHRQDGAPVILSRGVAIVPDGTDPDTFRRMNGGRTDVYTVSEWLATDDGEQT